MLLVASGILATFLTTSAILSKMVCDGIAIIIVQLDENLAQQLDISSRFFGGALAPLLNYSTTA